MKYTVQNGVQEGLKRVFTVYQDTGNVKGTN